MRRFGRLLTLVIAGEALAVAGFAGAIALSGRVIPQDVVASAAEAEALAWAWTAGSALVVVALGWARVVAGRAAHGLAYVMALEFETLAAVADAMTDTATVAGEDVARNVDDYLASFRSRRRKEVRIALLGFALRPLLGLRASSSTSASTATRAATRWSATRRRAHPRTRAGTPVSRRRACRRGRSRPTWSSSAAERPPASSPAGWRRASGMCS